MSLFIPLNYLCNSMSSDLCLMLRIPTSKKCAFSQRFPKRILYKEFDFFSPKSFIFNPFYVIISRLRYL